MNSHAAAPVRTLYSLVYVSSATTLFSSDELLALLETCRRNNRADGITGLLLYKEGNFMQALEGEESRVRRVHEKIQRDPRHRGLLTLLEQPVAERQFGDWSMGFKNLSDPVLQGTPGYSEFLNVPLDDRGFVANPSRAYRLLTTFRQKM